jgi:hypothetical protein
MLLNEQLAEGRRLAHLVVNSEDVYIAVFEDRPASSDQA